MLKRWFVAVILHLLRFLLRFCEYFTQNPNLYDFAFKLIFFYKLINILIKIDKSERYFFELVSIVSVAFAAVSRRSNGSPTERRGLKVKNKVVSIVSIEKTN